MKYFIFPKETSQKIFVDIDGIRYRDKVVFVFHCLKMRRVDILAFFLLRIKKNKRQRNAQWFI